MLDARVRRAAVAYFLAAGLGVSTLLVGCGQTEDDASRTPPIPASERSGTPTRFDRIARPEFNQLAAELFIPLFWLKDEGNDGVLRPSELVVLWGMGKTTRDEWVSTQEFTPRFVESYEQIVALHAKGPSDQRLKPEEAKRRAAVRAELGQARPMAVVSSFRGAPEEERAVVAHIMAASSSIERIYAKQNGWDGLRSLVPIDDRASQMLLYRNQSPWCSAAKTEADPDCNGLESRPKRLSGLYPPKLQEDPKFCDKLAKEKDGEKLLNQFVVVREKDDALVAVPYSDEYASDMARVSEELRAAADAIKSPAESAFKDYLAAAAQAFLDNGWERADEAWAHMNATNSRYYLRIGPDEVYWEPCQRKAGFHVSFARINQGSLAWQRKLEPVKNDMEQALARLAGEPYKARQVAFHLPDFIDVVLNAGDSRSPFGATVGQSLPNFGKVASENRGRTVAMVNLYTDPDSVAVQQQQASSLLCAATMAQFGPESDDLSVMGTLLHEAAHNLGPANEYRVKGKKATQIFGGPLASTMEELKAQTSALYFSRWLGDKGLVTPELAERANVRDIVWAFGHISRGMYGPQKEPKPYSHLSAIQLGYLRDAGAIEWRADEMAHNGKDKGCFELHLDRFPAGTEALLRLVAGALGRGDKDKAKELVERYVDVSGEKQQLLDVIRERWQRAPVASFVYSIEL
jgi:hypothetical protein